MLPRLRAVADVSIFDDFAPNTDANDLLVGLRLIDQHPVDAVLGIGGGSALDMAKLFTVYSGITGADALRTAIESHSIHDRASGLVLAPTTSGSGSEATHFAVVYVGDTKYSIADPQLRPDHIVLDPMLAISGSPHRARHVRNRCGLPGHRESVGRRRSTVQSTQRPLGAGPPHAIYPFVRRSARRNAGPRNGDRQPPRGSCDRLVEDHGCARSVVPHHQTLPSQPRPRSCIDARRIHRCPR